MLMQISIISLRLVNMYHFFSLFEDPIKVSIIYHIVDHIKLLYNIYPQTLINILSRPTIIGKYIKQLSYLKPCAQKILHIIYIYMIDFSQIIQNKNYICIYNLNKTYILVNLLTYLYFINTIIAILLIQNPTLNNHFYQTIKNTLQISLGYK